MAIPGPGPAISMTTLNTEFGGGFALSSYYRGGSFVPNIPQNAAIPTSGAIALGNFYGSTKRVAIALTASGNNYDVYTNRGPTYSAGVSDLTVTVPGTVGSANTASYAMLVPNAFNPADTVRIVNNGVIQGAGGGGGRGGSGSGPMSNPSIAGSVGGNALYVNRPTTITNNGTLAGGGGGGGGATVITVPRKPPAGPITYTGGGGGGGAGTVGGAGGVPVPGVGAGAAGTSGAGGAGGQQPPSTPTASLIGGAGGGRGAAGAAGASSPSTAGAAGGGAGNYLVGNAFVTFPATGTRQGGVS